MTSERYWESKTVNAVEYHIQIKNKVTEMKPELPDCGPNTDSCILSQI